MQRERVWKMLVETLWRFILFYFTTLLRKRVPYSRHTGTKEEAPMTAKYQPPSNIFTNSSGIYTNTMAHMTCHIFVVFSR